MSEFEKTTSNEPSLSGRRRASPTIMPICESYGLMFNSVTRGWIGQTSQMAGLPPTSRTRVAGVMPSLMTNRCIRRRRIGCLMRPMSSWISTTQSLGRSASECVRVRLDQRVASGGDDPGVPGRRTPARYPCAEQLGPRLPRAGRWTAAVAPAIAEGAHRKAIQARLGHASITTTLNTYGHLFPSLDVEPADRLEVARADALATRLQHADDPEVVPIEAAEH